MNLAYFNLPGVSFKDADTLVDLLLHHQIGMGPHEELPVVIVFKIMSCARREGFVYNHPVGLGAQL